MNSDKAAAVRDSINGCPDVVDPEDTGEYSRKLEDRHHGGVEVTFTGEHHTPDQTKFRPAYIKQSGELGNGDGATRPVYVVVLEPLWLDQTDTRSLSPELVHEIAKHGCHVRFYPPGHRLEGEVWVCDHFQSEIQDHDGDRCECGSTYWKLDDGDPVCAKCGRGRYDEHPRETATLEDYA
jgi:hypothetical protein